MRPIQRKLTVRGMGDVGGHAKEASVESERPSSVACPRPAVVASTTPSRYSLVAPRRETISMLATPVPCDDAPGSRRRPTMRMALSVEQVDCARFSQAQVS